MNTIQPENNPIKQLQAEISNKKKIHSRIIIVNTLNFSCKKHLISVVSIGNVSSQPHHNQFSATKKNQLKKLSQLQTHLTHQNHHTLRQIQVRSKFYSLQMSNYEIGFETYHVNPKPYTSQENKLPIGFANHISHHQLMALDH